MKLHGSHILAENRQRIKQQRQAENDMQQELTAWPQPEQPKDFLAW